MPPRIFVGSTVEGLDVAHAVQSNLEYDAFVTVWPHAFNPGATTLEDLVRAVQEHDFGVFILTGDDLVLTRGKRSSKPRDNVLFELGIFMGALGPRRSFMIVPRGLVTLPTDLAGVKPASYDATRIAQNASAALGAACSEIRGAIRRLGLRRDNMIPAHASVREAPSLSTLVATAKHDIFAFASSMTYVVQNLRDPLFARAEAGIEVRLVVMSRDKRAESIISRHAGITDFSSELTWAHNCLLTWALDARDRGLPLQVRTAPVVPLTLDVVDRHSSSGEMLIAPLAYQTAPSDRPCFRLSRASAPQIFDKYVAMAERWWTDTAPLAR
jgi:hypothetical protein